MTKSCVYGKTPKILVNKLICDDGTTLHSKDRWDYQEYTDANGKTYILDGGNDYIRTNGNGKLFTITTDDDHSFIRIYFDWTRRMDKDGNLLDEPEVIPLMEIEDGHLEALIEYTGESSAYPDYIIQLFINEKKYREGEL